MRVGGIDISTACWGEEGGRELWVLELENSSKVIYESRMNMEIHEPSIPGQFYVTNLQRRWRLRREVST